MAERPESLEERTFLKNYRKQDFDNPLVTVDSVLFTCHEQQLKVLLVERAQPPYKGYWGLPGGFIDPTQDNSLQATAQRKLQEKTGVTPPYLEQLYTVGGANRDPRSWSVTVCYSALIAYQNCAAHMAQVNDARWISWEQLATLPLAFDHQALMRQAHARLRQKALYSIVPAYALPEAFTLPELQQLHEIILGKPIQKKSFRRRIEQAELLVDSGEKRPLPNGRPATLYRMKPQAGCYTFVRNLEA